MKINKYYRSSLNIGIAVLLIEFLFKIMHWPGADLLWYISLAFTLAYVAIGIFLVLKDQGKGNFEKGAWVIGMIILPPIIGLIYYHTEIKRKNAST